MPAASLVVKVSAQVAEFQKNFAEATRTAQKFERDFANTASSVSAQQKRITDAFSTFSGDRLAREASGVAAAVAQIGGASKLTAQEQAKVNALMTEAIAKYNALGQTAPKSILDLEAATKKLSTTTASVQGTTSKFSGSLDDLQAKSSLSGRAIDVLTGTFGKFTLAGVAVGIINKLGGALTEMVSRGTQIAPLQDAFERLSSSVGENSRDMLDAMGSASRGLVTEFDLMQSANKALLLGLPTTSESMANLAKTATVLGKAMGQDATKSLDDLIVALGRSSPLILDNLGLTVKVEDANRKYAATLGITADALDEAQKKQAFMNEAMRKAEERVKQIGEQSLTLTEHAKTAIVSLSNIVTAAVGAVDRAAGQMITKAQNAVSTFSESFARGFGVDNFNVDDLNQALQTFAEASRPAAQGAETFSAQVGRLRQELSLLTPEQKKNVESGKALGQSNKEIAEAMHRLFPSIKLTEQHLNLLDKTTKDYVKTQKDQAQIDKEIFAGLNKRRDLLNETDKLLRKTTLAVTDYVVANRIAAKEVISATLPREVSDQWTTWTDRVKDNAETLKTWGGIVGAEMKRSTVEGKKFFDEMRKEMSVGLQFGQRLAQNIIGAFQGGGDIGKSIGAFLGSEIGAELGEGLAKTLSKTLGNKLGGAIGGLLGPLGALGGSLFGGLADKIFGSAGRDMVKAFASSQGGFDVLQKKIEALGPGSAQLWVNLTQGVGKNNPQQAQAAIDAVTAALGRSNAAANQLPPTFADVTAAAQRYGLEVDKIGDGINDLRVMEFATQAVKDWQLLASAGADLEQVAKGMADEMQSLVIESAKFGHALPEAMRPILQKMIDMGLLTDDAGEKLTDLTTLHFEKPLADAIDGLIGKMDQLIDKISNGLGGAIRNIPSDIGLDIPQLASGGIVRSPTLALIGESGPEAVIPLGGGGGGFGQDSAPIVTRVYLDGRQIAEAVAPHTPHVVKRRG